MRASAVGAVILLCVFQLGQAAAEPKTIRILTVGNSFANNALEFLPELVAASGNELVVARANLGGCTMLRHWNHVLKYEADRSDADARPYANGQLSLAELLVQEPWDFVTIQQVSMQSHDPATYHPYAGNLHRYIGKHAPQAIILMHQIWAYRVDDKRFTPANEGIEPHTQQAMYQQVRDTYHQVAKELGVRIVPSGDAMYLADTDSQWGYKPDLNFQFATAEFPNTPDQTHSLHVGWRWKEQKDGTRKLQMDGHHASMAGEYLLGCVWYEALYGQSVIDNSFVPKGLDASYARFLRKAAHQAVALESIELQTAKP